MCYLSAQLLQVDPIFSHSLCPVLPQVVELSPSPCEGSQLSIVCHARVERSGQLWTELHPLHQANLLSPLCPVCNIISAN